MDGRVAVYRIPFGAQVQALASLRILDQRPDCTQPGLENCTINSCSDKRTIERRRHAPTGPEWDLEQVGVWLDEHGPVPVVNVTWKIQADGGVKALRGSEISVLDESTNKSICVQFSYKLKKELNPTYLKWTFSLDGVVVEPGRTYMLSLFNLPEPDIEDYRLKKQITIPGCADRRIQKAQMCLENGSLWDPNVTTFYKQGRRFLIVVGFKAAQYSERYQVSIQSRGFHCSKNVSKENQTLLNVSFEFGWWQLSHCKMVLMIQPFFVRCKKTCRRPEKIIDLCEYSSPRTSLFKATVGLLAVGVFLACLLWKASHKDPVNTSSSTSKQQPDGFQMQNRRRVLIIYSLDHPLYKNIVLKLCSFMASKCGTEVVLDLLDSTRLGVLGSIQWLDCHRDQTGSSSDKILILCSRGVRAKWRAMCGDKPVCLREDACSAVGDMLSPALSLMVPHFVRSASFEKYILAYFDDVCCEEDVPPPFNITVRYKLMKQFEELFFRIMDTEKREPGRVNHVEGFSEREYFRCPSGGALRDALEAFHAYQLENPQWFEDELLGHSVEIQDMMTDCVPDSTQVGSHVKTKERDLTRDKTGLYMA
uniref:SEFIR domain-containing protein n=1 Tax=Gasterosteus aculeatus aculeatus TaxID=481459 RepID=A0AAQ4RJY2_GASAC|nr:interleukin-17 receptor A isoform X1 [Gasterosteus aculeatus aculeatus]